MSDVLIKIYADATSSNCVCSIQGTNVEGKELWTGVMRLKWYELFVLRDLYIANGATIHWFDDRPGVPS